MLAAFERRRPDRPPTSLRCIEEVWARLMAHFSVATRAEVLDALDVDLRWVSLPFIGPPERSAIPLASEGVDFWGCRNVKVVNAFNAYYEIPAPPLAGARSVADVHAHDWPSLDWWDYGAVPRLIDAECRSDRRAILFFAGGAFETPWMLRGFEQFLVDLETDPEIAEAISDHASEYYRQRAMRVLEAAGGSIDIIGSGGDVGTQLGMILSPQSWRQHIGRFAARLIAPFHARGLKTFYHSCGSCLPIVDDLIAMGLDMLDPIQVTAAGMQPESLFARFGDRLSFHGGIDETELLTHGKPRDVARETRRTIDVLGRNGGYIVSPTHQVQGDTPVENILAVYETARVCRWSNGG